MDKRKLVTFVAQAIPGIGWGLVPALFGLEPTVSPWIVAAVLLILGIGSWALYWVFIEPHLHPTMADMERQQRLTQDALDKMINYRFITDGGNWQLKAAEGLSDEQKYLQHAPADYREDAYRRLGLSKPTPREPYR